MTRPPSRRREQQRLAGDLRAVGRSWDDIADVFRRRYGLNARAALRLVRGWSQERAAEEWSRRWPDDIKAAKNFSHWETWPQSGHSPSLDVLDRLAQLYECSVADLVADLGDHRHLDRARHVPGQLVPAIPTATPAANPLTPASLDIARVGPGANEDLDGSATRQDLDLDGLEAIELMRRVEHSDTGQATIAAVESGVDRLSRSYAHVAPTTLLASLRRFQRYVAQLLDGRMTLAQRRDLMRQAGWLSILTGTADIDLGYHRAAGANFDLARQLAKEAGDPSIAAWAAETEAWQALSGGDPTRAAALCHEGLGQAQIGTSSHIQLCTQLARVSARLGDAPTTHRLIDQCVAEVDRLPTPGAEQHHFATDQMRVLSFCAVALVWLGDDSRSTDEYARKAVAQYEGQGGDHFVHELAVARLNLALLLARQGQPDEAAQLGMLAFASTWRLCRTDVFLATDLDRTLMQRHRTHPDASSFHEHYLEMRQQVARHAMVASATTTDG